MGGHKPVPRCWVGDIDRGVVLQHLEEEGGLHRGIVGEAGAQWVDDRRGAVAEVPGGRESREVSGVWRSDWRQGKRHGYIWVTYFCTSKNEGT